MNDTYSIQDWKSKIKECEGVQGEMHKEWGTSIDLYNCKYTDNNAAYDPERVDVNFVNIVYNRDRVYT